MIKISLVIVSFSLLSSLMFPTDFKECFDLNGYYNSQLPEIMAKIHEYEKKLLNNPDDYYANLAIAILYENISSSEQNPDATSSENIVKNVEKFLKKEPDNPFAMVYLALGHSLVSRDSDNSIVKIFEVNNAISIFNKAVKEAKDKPIEWFTRYMRANFFMNLPEFFNKRKEAETDFGFVLNEYHTNQSIEGYMVTAYYYLGELQKSKNDTDSALEYWNNSVSLAAKLNYKNKESKKAEKEIETFGSNRGGFQVSPDNK
jgi:tetratricopeptide (TPR) repeat protein